MATDFVGKSLATGDAVVFIPEGRKKFSVGTINRVFPQKVEVVYETHHRGGKSTVSIFMFPEDVVHV